MKVRTIAMLMLGAFSLAGCKQAMEQLNRDLDNLNQGLASANQTRGQATKPGAMANQAAQTAQIQLITPKDEKTNAAIDAALPTIKKVLAIHQCIKVDDGMLQLNAYSLPGVAMEKWILNYPNSSHFMKYHDRSKCVSVRAIDNFAMPALNALSFRVVYFAEDSGETVNFGFQMRKADDGRWLLSSSLRPTN